MTSAQLMAGPGALRGNKLLRMAKARAGSKGGRIKHERSDKKAAQYINPRSKT